ncbi:MazG nucleotide pyrophosphohydrolase [Bibersteinia trehalosi USDA-ARS-USMARC-188]|uniref:MazG nucleotide pyrophosphohydrolase n=1 Tax=Bibersteinia trehalosi USDA-ARS-USMARC-188 TaxID=1263829 RepID=A0A4V7IB48_BIBTR|nr:MazG-like family protein [Bibersteinia trehalosi]AHG82234.1 MazG nucleotide pyrophosphohydrolase [Bibersteinia trehalosi USDA-ARS-USMARC-188]
MHFSDYQKWGREFYQQQGWYERDVFRRLAYLTEEVGEVAAAVRAIEIGYERPDKADLNEKEKCQALIEELGDVLDNLCVLADKYGIELEEVIAVHQAKFNNRYK